MLPLPKGAVWQAFLVLCLVLLVKEANAEARVVCYYTNWSVYRPGTAKFNPQNINPYLCTHLIYAFGGFTKDNTLKPFDKYQDIEQGGYAKFTGLKSYNKQLKTMLAIGGWNEASSRFSPLVANPDRRQQFIRNILKFLRQNHFDGLDLDWEYPAFRDGGKPRDRDNYAQFVEELRSEFDRESSKTGRPRLLLTMAVPAGIEYIEKGYDVPKLNQYLDWFNILSYDYHSAFEPSVNHHAPLYSLEEPSEYNYDVELNIDYTVKFYLEAGADRDKLVLGIPTYGRSYTLINDEDTEIGAPADGPGEQGEATREKGYLAYYEICQSINEDPTWTVVQPNDKAMGPYAYRGNQWVGYDDENIARKKAQYVAENGLGGIMFWSLDNDDFRGTCTGRQYPLIEAAKEALLEATGFGANEVSAPARPQKASRPRSRAGSSTTRNRITEHTKITKESNTSVKHTSSSRRKSNKKKSSNTPRTTTTTTTVGSLYIGGRTTTPPPPTTPDPGADFKCEEEGFFPHPRDCKKYFWCLDSGPSNLGIVAHQFTCPSGLYFNTAADSCDFTRNVVCKKPSKETTTPRTTASTTTTTTTTTTSAPKRITAATSSYSYIQRTSTTAEPEDDDEEEEYEDEEDGDAAGHEEDPKVIKELIELIKRVGGLEELEKQLQLQEDGTVVMKNPKNDEVSTTPSSISQSLYAKVLSRPNPLSSLRNRLGGSKFTAKKEEISTSVNEESSSSKYTSVNRNSRPSPQNAGIDKLAEFEGFLKDKPKYVTINRTRPTKSTGPDIDEPEELTEEEENADAVEVEDTSEANAKRTSSSYVNIRRTRPTKSADTLVEKSESELEVNEAAGGQSSAKTQYQTINRVRGTAISSGTDELVEEEEVSENTKSTRPKSTYQTLTRTKTTTSEQTEGENKEAELQVQSKVEYQSFTRTRNTTTSAIQDDNAAESEDETSNKRKTRPTYQSFTRTRGTTVANTDEIEKEETGEEQNVRTKQTYQSLSRFRPSTSASTAEEEVEETGGQTRTRTRISPTASSDQQPGKTRGTTVATSSVDKSEAEEVQKKNRYSLFTRRQSTVGLASEAEDINELAPTEPTISSRTRGTTVSSSSVVEDEIVLKSVGSTNRFQIYNRTRPTSPVDTAPITSLTLEEAEATLKTLEDDTIPTITVQYSDPSLANTTPISAPQDQEIPSVTPDYTNIVRRSTTTTTPSAPLTSTSITATTSSPQTLSPETSPPDLSQPSIETVTQNSLLIELSDPSSTDPITLTPTPNIEVSSVSPTEVVVGGLLEKSADQNEVASKDSLPIISTAPALDTVEIAQNQVSELNTVSSSNSRQDTVDKVTLVTGEKEVGVEAVERQGLVENSELTRTNSKFESSLNNVNSESSLSSNVDSEDSVLIITRTTSTTTSRPAFSSPTSVRQSRPTAPTSRFNTRRRPTQSTTSTTTTEEPEEFVSILSSPRPFSLPSRRRTRPSQTRTTTTTETSLDVSEPTSRSRSTTRTRNITSSRRGGYNQVNSTTRSSSTRYNSTTATVSPTDDVQNITSSTVSGRRRVAIFRVRRPVNRTNISNVGRGNVARTANKDLGDNENKDSDSTSTQQTLTSTTESSTAPRRFTVRRKLIRKRPVENSATTLPSAGSGISSETGSTRFDENVNISETEVPRSTTALPTTRRRKTSTVRPKAFSPSRSSVGDAEDKASSTTESPDDLIPTRRFRKVIRRLKKPAVNASTTVVPVLKFVPQTDGRIHLLKVGEEAKNQTIEDEEIVSKVLLDVKESVRSFDPESTTLELEQRFNHTTLSNTLEVSSEEPTTQKVETETIRDYELETNGTHPLDPIETIDETANITVTDEEELRIKLLSEGEFNLTRPLETTPLAPTLTITEAPVLPEEGESPAINDTSITAATEPSSEISNTTIIPDDVSNTTIPGEDIGENATIIPPTSSDVSQNLNDTSSTESTSTTTTTKSKLFASRRPYKPTKPSISAITSTEATSPTPKSYVRKYSTNFTSIKSPADIDNPVGIIIPKVPSVLKQTPNKYRLKSTTARTTPSNGDEANDAEEEEYDEYTKVEEEDGDAPHKIALIKPNYVLINRTPKAESHLEENPQQGLEANEDEEEDDSEEEDYDEEEKITQLSKSQIPNVPHPIPPVHSNQPNSPVLSLGIPAIPPVLVQPNSPIDLLKMVLAPGQLPPPIPAVSLNTATESGAVVRLNNGFVGVLQKSESKEDESDNDTTTPSTTTTRRHPTHRITRPSNKPRVVNRPFVTTIHPASLRLAVTSPPKPTTPAPFRTNSTRNYERKYTASSSTESTLSDNSLLEDLNIDALNARNKKIFQETSRKHTTVKPKTTQKDGVEYNITGYTNETESESYYTTQLHNFDSDGEYVGDDVNGFNQFQENVLENSQHSPATPIPPTSTTSKMTTLHHVFELSEEDHTTTAPGDTKDYVHTVMTSDPRKLVEINRIVEIYSKQNVYKINVNNHTTQNISSTELKLEKLPRVDHIGEISRAALVNLVDSTGRARSEETHGRSLEYQGSNVLIEGRSTVADYKPTEEIPVTEFTPVRNSIPEYQNDQGARAGKVNRHPFVPDVLSGVETSTISLEGLFEFTRKSKSGRVINSPVFATSLGEVRPNVIHEVVRSVNSPQQATTSATLATTEPTVFAGATTFAPEIPTQTPTPVSTTETPTTTSTPPTTTTIGPIQTTERPTAKTEKSINYVRPLVPLLRPESNESSPLVISIANLDKVTLSKVPRDGSVASSGRVSTFVRPDGSSFHTFTTGEGYTSSGADSESTVLQEHYKTNEPIVHTQTSYSSEIHIVKKRVPRKHSKRRAHRKRNSNSISLASGNEVRKV